MGRADLSPLRSPPLPTYLTHLLLQTSYQSLILHRCPQSQSHYHSQMDCNLSPPQNPPLPVPHPKPSGQPFNKSQFTYYRTKPIQSL